MILVIGLGNPGGRYALTRHNIGWIIIDALAKKWDFPALKENKKARALITKKVVLGKTIILAKPITYMNLSGASVCYLKKYFKIKLTDIFVIHDDLDIPFGKVKINFNRGPGGHKGVNSIITLLKTKNFYRFRVGIKLNSIIKIPTEKFVLNNFTKTEQAKLPSIAELCLNSFSQAMAKSPEQAMNKTN